MLIAIVVISLAYQGDVWLGLRMFSRKNWKLDTAVDCVGQPFREELSQTANESALGWPNRRHHVDIPLNQLKSSIAIENAGIRHTVISGTRKPNSAVGRWR